MSTHIIDEVVAVKIPQSLHGHAYEGDISSFANSEEITTALIQRLASVRGTGLLLQSGKDGQSLAKYAVMRDHLKVV